MSEAVPASLGIFLAAEGDPFLCVVGGANSGSDTDTVACIAGSIAGAFKGFTAVPVDLYWQVVEANGLDLEGKARQFATAILQEREMPEAPGPSLKSSPST
jgi:ADP-ribosylglycohydrolase